MSRIEWIDLREATLFLRERNISAGVRWMEQHGVTVWGNKRVIRADLEQAASRVQKEERPCSSN